MILIVVAMKEEADSFIPKLTLKQTHPFTIYEGQLKHKEVLLIITGVGKTNSAAALSFMLTKYPQIKYIINLGVVGGYKVKLFNTYLVNQASYHDVDLTVFDYDFGQIPKFPTYYFPDVKLTDKLTKYEGIKLFTGDIFSTKPIKNEPYVVDMEGASLYQIAHLFKYPLISLKVVSDVIGHQNQVADYIQNEQDLSIHLFNALDYVLEVLD